MGPRISDRIGAINESATLAITTKAKALKAAGEPVIGFGAGEPDFPTPPAIVEAAVAACQDPANHKYTPAAGLPELREAVASKTLRDSGFACEAANVLVTIRLTTSAGEARAYELLAAGNGSTVRMLAGRRMPIPVTRFNTANTAGSNSPIAAPRHLRDALCCNTSATTFAS